MFLLKLCGMDRILCGRKDPFVECKLISWVKVEELSHNSSYLTFPDKFQVPLVMSPRESLTIPNQKINGAIKVIIPH